MSETQQKQEQLWGTLDGDRVTDDPNEIIEDIVDMIPPDGWDAAQITVHRWERRKLAWFPDVLAYTLECLDDEYSDVCTNVTPGMKAAAKAFEEAIRREYKVWFCEPTKESITVNALEWVKEHRPGWLESSRDE